MADSTLTISTRAIVRWLGAVIACLLLASILSSILIRAGVRPNGHKMFFVDREVNFPALFSTLQIFVAALLLAAIGFAERQRAGAYGWHWLALAAGFGGLAADEMLSFHERLSEPMRNLLGAGRTLGVFNFAWVVPALVLVAAIGMAFWRFLLHLPAATRLRFILSAALYLGGAVGMEMLDGWQHENDSRRLGLVSYRVEDMSVTYLVMIHIEEALEMVGILAFVRALLLHLGQNYGSLAVSFASAPAATPRT